MTTSRTAREGIELGLYTFGDLVADPHSQPSEPAKPHDRLRAILDAAKLADEIGLDVFGLGEHHRLDCAISSPAVVLAAIAQITKRVKLTSATTVLPTVDPVRVFEDFATVDLLSNGRAEILLGRGAFTESYPLYGYDLAKRDALFAEHLGLLLQLNRESRVTWEGQLRPALRDAQIAPRPFEGRAIPLWIGVGVTPESAARAGMLGLPMNLAILGTATRMKPLVDVYRAAGREAGHANDKLKVAISSHMFIQKTSQGARDVFHPHHAAYFTAMGRQGMSRSDFDAIVDAKDGLLVGSPEEVAEKILLHRELFGHDRYLGQIDIGGLPFTKVAEVIELFATRVAPIVKKASSI